MISFIQTAEQIRGKAVTVGIDGMTTLDLDYPGSDSWSTFSQR